MVWKFKKQKHWKPKAVEPEQKLLILAPTLNNHFGSGSSIRNLTWHTCQRVRTWHCSSWLGQGWWSSYTVYRILPDTHVWECKHDIVLHGGVRAGVQQLTKGGDDPLGLRAHRGLRLTASKYEQRPFIWAYNSLSLIACFIPPKPKQHYPELGLGIKKSIILLW